MATLSFEDYTLHIEPTKRAGVWRLSAHISQGAPLTPRVLSCISSVGTLRWQQGAFLQHDRSSHTLSLVEEINIHPGSYLSFKKHIHNFLDLFQEFKEFFTL